MVAWRAVGINYVRFSQIAAEVTRQCTKTAIKSGTKKPSSPATLKVCSHVLCCGSNQVGEWQGCREDLGVERMTPLIEADFVLLRLRLISKYLLYRYVRFYLPQMVLRQMYI
ncbi:hypothetical protein DICVIV_03537 [Dictyocaulus viviparus]|uniref:Uncharacterized protein n=1 Tax=Dictyocaulus viviparus TaxID=29172 RepID=A0A0D8Y0F5_DICVI|nr:hypothetical protein DICVIV_03537 [Dictyocaulus viviparus]